MREHDRGGVSEPCWRPAPKIKCFVYAAKTLLMSGKTVPHTLWSKYGNLCVTYEYVELLNWIFVSFLFCNIWCWTMYSVWWILYNWMSWTLFFPFASFNISKHLHFQKSGKIAEEFVIHWKSVYIQMLLKRRLKMSDRK